MIKDRLAKPNTITPTKRDYSPEKQQELPPQTIRSIDPYRELPTKE